MDQESETDRQFRFGLEIMDRFDKAFRLLAESERRDREALLAPPVQQSVTKGEEPV